MDFPYYVGKNPYYEKNPSQSARVQNAVLGCNLKNDRMISVCFQGKPFSIRVIQVYAPTTNAKKLKLKVLWWSTRPSRTNTKKRCPFHHRVLECKRRKWRDSWSNRQVWPWSTKWSGAKANRVLQREHTGHSTHPLPTTKDTTLHLDITRWSIPKSDWLFFFLQLKMEKLYTVSKNKTWGWLWLRPSYPCCKSQLNWRK